MDQPFLTKATGLRRKASMKVTFCVKKERDSSYRKVSKILQKDEKDRTEEDHEVLSTNATIVKEVSLRLEKRKKILARAEEFEDESVLLDEKCKKLAAVILEAKHLVVYTGAGMSTAASIPDYRGSNGIWTRLEQGKDIGNHDLSLAEPTLAHMALSTLYKKGALKYVVSQNCDGLHLRSGLPRWVLSEVHGNMYLEVCTKCNVEVWRSFDVTQHTGRYAHNTARRCSQCCQPLRDTIVHFGERGNLAWPINWSGACQAAKQADVILCIGSSLKVLKKYPWLWGMDKPVRKRPQLYIVNLQWTPKDDQASLKINGKCDEVMKRVMGCLGLEIPTYDRALDPIFTHATELHPLEEHTTSTQMLVTPQVNIEFKSENIDLELEPINENKIQKIVSEIKKEKDIWRPFSNEINISPENSPPLTEEVGPLIDSEGFSMQVDIFDEVYQKLAHKILQQTDLEYYKTAYLEEPLDLSKPKTECAFCWDHFNSVNCQFYLKRETKLPSSGPVCYCCDSEDEVEPVGPTDLEKKAPPNPGWFGKGYRKKLKKKR